MALCTITGSVSAIDGSLAEGTSLIFERLSLSGQDNTTVIPSITTAIVDGSGNISVTLYSGTYRIFSTLSATSYTPERTILTVLTVPDQSSAILSEIIEQTPEITPTLVAQTLTYRNETESLYEATQQAAVIVTEIGQEVSEARVEIADARSEVAENTTQVATDAAMAESAVSAAIAARDAAQNAALSLGATAYAARDDLPSSPLTDARGYVYADPIDENNGLWFWTGTGWLRDTVNAATVAQLQQEVDTRSEIIVAGDSESGNVRNLLGQRAIMAALDYLQMGALALRGISSGLRVAGRAGEQVLRVGADGVSVITATIRGIAGQDFVLRTRRGQTVLSIGAGGVSVFGFGIQSSATGIVSYVNRLRQRALSLGGSSARLGALGIGAGARSFLLRSGLRSLLSIDDARISVAGVLQIGRDLGARGISIDPVTGAVRGIIPSAYLPAQDGQIVRAGNRLLIASGADRPILAGSVSHIHLIDKPAMIVRMDDPAWAALTTSEYQGIPGAARTGSRDWVAAVRNPHIDSVGEEVGNVIVLAYSDDGWETHNTAFAIVLPNYQDAQVVDPDLYVDANGRLHISYMAFGQWSPNRMFTTWEFIIKNPLADLDLMYATTPEFRCYGQPGPRFDWGGRPHVVASYWADSNTPAHPEFAQKVIYEILDNGAYCRVEALPDLGALNSADETSVVECQDGTLFSVWRVYQGLKWSRRDLAGVWSTPAELSEIDPAIFGATTSSRAMVKISPSGRLVLAWNDSDTRSNLCIALSEDGGRTWIGRTVITSGGASYPAITFDGDTIIIVYDNDRQGQGLVQWAEVSEANAISGSATVTVKTAISHLKP